MMRRYLVVVAMVMALSFPALTQAAEAHSAEAKEVNATFDRYVDGWQKGNIKELGEIYANDAQVTAYWPDPSKATRLEGWTRIQTELKDVFDRIHGMDLDFDQRKIDIYGQCAILTTHWVWHHPADPIFATGRATFVFNQEGSRWILVHEHSSVTPFIPGEEPQPVAAAAEVRH